MPIDIIEHEPLSRYTSFRIGGYARYFVRIKDVSDLPQIVAWIAQRGLSYYVLGGGTNTLVSDEGFSGLVIKIEDRSYHIDGNRVVASAGASYALIAQATSTNGLSGVEWAFGIPGTIGGAVRGNAGAFGGSIGDVCVSIDVIDPDSSAWKTLTKSELGFRYRWSALGAHRFIIARALLELVPQDPAQCRAALEEFSRQKRERQPLGAQCAGSIFKNVETSALDPSFIPAEYENAQLVHAGFLIDTAGLKGTKVGGAMVSEKHANFILNTGGATCADVIQLIAIVKQRVRDRWGIELSEEIRYLGNPPFISY